MIQKVVNIEKLENCQSKKDLEFWLSKEPTERLAAVDYLRKQVDGSSKRLQKVIHITKRPPS